MDTKLLLEHLYVCTRINKKFSDPSIDLGQLTFGEVSLLIAGLQLLLRQEQREKYGSQVTRHFFVEHADA